MKVSSLSLLLASLASLPAAALANIGFEFETQVELVKSPVGWKAKKGAPLERGAAVEGLRHVPWEMQLDELPRGFDIEYVTPPEHGFKHTKLKHYGVMCRAMSSLYRHLAALRNAVNGGKLVTSGGSQWRTFWFKASNGRQFKLRAPAAKRDLVAAPQVTMGLPLERVFAFFKEVVSNDQLAAIANVDVLAGNPLAFYRNLVNAIDGVAGISKRAKAYLLFLTDLRCNGAKMRVAQSYAKLYATNLPRSSLGAVYALLKDKDRNAFAARGASEAEGLQALVEEIGVATNCRAVVGAQPAWPARMFPLGWRQGKRSTQMRITAAQYFQALVAGNDPLRGGDFESMGRLPASLNDFVFELRRMKKLTGDPTTGVRAWIERALDLYDFAYRIRNKADFKDQRFKVGANRRKNDERRCALPYLEPGGL